MNINMIFQVLIILQLAFYLYMLHRLLKQQKIYKLKREDHKKIWKEINFLIQNGKFKEGMELIKTDPYHPDNIKYLQKL
jgi:hypothetical protein